MALNIGFLSAVLARSSLEVETSAAQAQANIESLRLTVPDGYTGYGSYYEALLSRGLSDVDTKTLVLARLEARARALAIEPPPPYWQRNAGSAPTSALRLAAELEHARAALVEVFGADVEHDPAFTRLFRPLDPVFSFMSSAQQVALQKLKLERQVEMHADPAPHAPVAEPAPKELAESLGTVLEPTALHEYLLRDSPLADQLRQSAVDFTEAEFRATFDILRSLEQGVPEAELYANARNALRALLGGRRFAILWAGRDPLFAAVQRVGDKHALDEERVLSVYELFNDHQDTLLEATRSAGGDRERQRRGLQDAQARLETRLSGLVGAEVAADIERSYAQQAMALSRNLAHE